MRKVVDFIIDHPWLRILVGVIVGSITALMMDDGNWIVGSAIGGIIFLVLPFIIIVGGADLSKIRKK